METVDEEFLDASIKFMEKAVKDNKPFFCWWNSTRMHIFTHLKKESQGKTGLGVYPDGMVEHDGHVGKLLDKLDQLGITDNTIVMYSTDNGAEVMSWPDGGTTPFRGEKDTNFEGGWRVPCAIRWPGVIKPGTVSNEVFSHQDMLPTLAAAGGDPDVVEKLKKGGYKSGNKTFKVHIDGYNLLPFLRGEVKENPRKGFLYWSDDGDLMSLRVGNWKCTFMEQRGKGLGVWEEPLVPMRVPNIYNLRSDPFERASEDATMFYGKWKVDRAFLLVPAQEIVGQFLATFKEFPRDRSRQASASTRRSKRRARIRRPWPPAVARERNSVRHVVAHSAVVLAVGDGVSAAKRCRKSLDGREHRVADVFEGGHRALAGLVMASPACVANHDRDVPRSAPCRTVGSIPISVATPTIAKAFTPASRSTMSSGVPSNADIVILSKIASEGRGTSSGTI